MGRRRNDMLRKLLPLFAAIIIAVFGQDYVREQGSSPPAPSSSAAAPQVSDSIAPPELIPGQMTRGAGTVVAILADDNEGSRHQRFIIELANGRTLLVAHNIDVAPRIPNLQRGDIVHFYGEFEPNDRGGVIHWTHRDLRGNHEHGWLEHKGERYW